MKRKRTSFMLAVTATLALCLTGCSNKSSKLSNNVTNYYTVTMDGDLIYYEEDSEKLVTTSKVATDFMTACVNKNYLNPEFKEYDYYRKSVIEKFTAENKQEQTKNTLNTNQLSIQALEQEVVKIEFYYLNGLENCMVTMNSFSQFDHVTDEYLVKNKISLGKKYNRVTKVLLVNEDGWKVDSYTQTGRVEA